MNECYFYGVWKYPGHRLFAANRSAVSPSVHREVMPNWGLDGLYAPLEFRHTGDLTWLAEFPRGDWGRIRGKTLESIQGRFLRHELTNGFTILQWWDRCQGDDRGGCNSTLLVRGYCSSEELLAIGRMRFPLLFENLARHGVELVEVFPRRAWTNSEANLREE